VARRIRSIEKSNDLIGNRNRDLQARNTVPTTLPAAPLNCLREGNKKGIAITVTRGGGS
jgi:hypothetical protein